MSRFQLKKESDMAVTAKVSKPGKSIYLDRVGLWYDPNQGEIHMTAPAFDWFHTTVSNDPKSKRYHPNLFAKLARALNEAGADAPPIGDKHD
jgi:hypothetical protein